MKKYDHKQRHLNWFLRFMSTDVKQLTDREIHTLKADSEYYFRPRLPVGVSEDFDFHGWNDGTAISWLPEKIEGVEWVDVFNQIRTALINFLNYEFIEGDEHSFSGLHHGQTIAEATPMFGIMNGKGVFYVAPRMKRNKLSVDDLILYAKMNLASLLTVSRESIKVCEWTDCGAYFLHLTQKRRNFCSPKCAARAAAKNQRLRDPEVYREKQRVLSKTYYKKKKKKSGRDE